MTTIDESKEIDTAWKIVGMCKCPKKKLESVFNEDGWVRGNSGICYICFFVVFDVLNHMCALLW